MKKTILFSILLMTVSAAAEPSPNLGALVDPFIGTGGIPYVCGQNFPGATLPFGMVRLSPDTANLKKALNTSGYYYGDTNVLGFSHTRLSGTGATDGGNFLVVPTVEPLPEKILTKGQYASFDHDSEQASPGYYSVELPKIGVLAELTATTRVGVHRYTFSQDATPHLLIDITSVLGKGRAAEGVVRILPERREIEGTARTFSSFSGRYGGIKPYFVARFSEPFSSYGVWNGDDFSPGAISGKGDKIGADVAFAPGGGDAPRIVELQIALSYVSLANARENLEKETGDDMFDAVLEKAERSWEEALSLITIDGATDKRKKIFYTALYHSLAMPTVFEDTNGQYFGFDKKVHSADDYTYYTDISLWDTFRTIHPLFILIAPEVQRDIARSLVAMSEQGGYLPRWPSGNGYTNSMFGTSADMTIAETYLKGITDFDVETAYRAMKKTALAETPKGAPFSGRGGLAGYLEHGYCPSETMKKAVSRTLEFAYADHSIGLLAQALGKEEEAKTFLAHGQNYRNVWNPETQYFQPRKSSGEFDVNFRPKLLTYLDFEGKFTNDYVEGSALQWRWAVPHDPQGLISLFESPEYFVAELEDFFAGSTPSYAAMNPGPYYWHGNEPDLYSAYLFNAAGRPELTQKWVRWVLENKYGLEENGIDGNDDAGTLSAWYILSALGFYPIAGTDRYEIGAPLFEKAVVNMGDKTLTVVADNYGPDRSYAKKVWLNDALLDRTWFRHEEIREGGVLRFEMSDQP